MSLAEEIAALLYVHDCVIVPDFGGFLAQYRPAVLQRSRKRILPPGKEITFNRNLVRNDGLLADRLAQQQDMAYQGSVEVIKDHVSEWEKVLSTTGRLELKNLGVFVKDANGKLQFEPDRSLNFASNSFGLRATSAIPQDKQTRQVVKAQEVPVLEIDTKEAPKKSNGSIVYWSAAALAALILTASTLTFLSVGPTNGGEFANLWPVDTSDSRSYQPRSETTSTIYSGGDEPELLSQMDLHPGINEVMLTKGAERTVPVLVPSVATEADAESTKVVMPDAIGRYHVIVGCFAVEENAHNLVSRYNSDGITARLLDTHNGLYRVAAGSFSTKTEALAGLKEVRGSGSEGAWLLIK